MPTLTFRTLLDIALGGETKSLPTDIRAKAGLNLVAADVVKHLPENTSPGSETVIWQGANHGSATPAKDWDIAALMIVIDEDNENDTERLVEIGLGWTSAAGAVTETVVRLSRMGLLLFSSQACDVGGSFSDVIGATPDRLTRIRGLNQQAAASNANDVYVRFMALKA